jgi:hypothetical protein
MKLEERCVEMDGRDGIERRQNEVNVWWTVSKKGDVRCVMVIDVGRANIGEGRRKTVGRNEDWCAENGVWRDGRM